MGEGVRPWVRARRQEGRAMNLHRTGSAAVLTIGFALAVSPMSVAAASQNGSTSKHGEAKSESSSRPTFCSYVASAGDIYGSDEGEFEHEDPAMKRMVLYFEKAQSLAPTAALKKSVTAMLKLTKADLTAKNPNKVNFSAASKPVSKWGDAHCPSSESEGFDSFVSSSGSGGSGGAGNSGSSGSSSSSTQGKASLTAFCKDVQTVTRDFSTLLETSKNGERKSLRLFSTRPSAPHNTWRMRRPPASNRTLKHW